jgi:type IV fimbrial biogenesis protein FimT
MVGQRGVTLIELIFGMLVFAILLGLGVPSFANLVRENRIAALNNDLVTAFALARSEASRRGLPVAVCASSDGISCSGATNWASGWLLYTDDAGTAGTIDGSDQMLQAFPRLPSGYSLSGEVDFIRFFPNGLTAPAGDKRFDLRNAAYGDHARCVSVSGIGRVATLRAGCA